MKTPDVALLDAPTPRRPGRRAGAFSLVELTMVIAIMGILLAVAYPRLSGYMLRDRVRRAAQKVASDIRLAQSQAIHPRTATAVTFRVDQDAYGRWFVDRTVASPDWYLAEDIHAADNQAVYSLSADQTYSVAIVSADFGGDPVIVFDPYGVPLAEGSVWLGVGRMRVQVEVEGALGRVTVHPLTEAASPVLPNNVPRASIVLPSPGSARGGNVNSELPPALFAPQAN
jgi:prepilin-type N-terminal cleavage/methylation domain-containing protein